MNYLFFRNGIVAIEATPQAFNAIQIAARQIGDDVARLWERTDDANDLWDVVRNSLSNNGLGTVRVLGAVAMGGLAAAAIAPLVGTAAGGDWPAGAGRRCRGGLELVPEALPQLV